MKKGYSSAWPGSPRVGLSPGLRRLGPPGRQLYPDRTAWMRTAHWGVMTHYLADWRAKADGGTMSVERWNALVDHFDTETLANQLLGVGAGYYQISIGQNSGYYLSPNSVYDRLVGIVPSKCSRRDLVADLAAVLQTRGIKLMVYLLRAPREGDHVAATALSYHRGPDRNREFQEKWQLVIREWSVRWGTTVAGWWFDGCYWPNTMYRSPGGPNFTTFAAAARAGNPSAVVAFNPGVVYRTISLCRDEDFTAGEIDKPELWTPKRVEHGVVDGAQIHVLSYLGQTWGMGAPRFTDEQAIAFSRKVAAVGGIITWDVPIQAGGTISKAFYGQLAAIGRAMAQPISPASAPDAH